MGQTIDIERPDGLFTLNNTMSELDQEIAYHKSWDWLIPVVKEIREVLNTELTIDEFSNMRDTKMSISPYDLSLKQVYEGVIEFIKWYNNKDKPPNNNQILGQSTII